MKIWLDDIRTEPKGWVRCRWPEEVVQLLETEEVEEISLDHDLNDTPASYMDHERTGYDVLLAIEAMQNADPNWPIPRIHIHTGNASARVKMELAVEAIERRRNRIP